MRGYVYVLTNKAMPGLVKIGRSKNAGLNRAKSLYNGDTGTPLPFELAFECLFDDCVEAEKLVHESLQSYRVNEKREFFSLDCEAAIEAVLQIRAEYIGHVIAPGDYQWAIDDINYMAYVLDEHPFILSAAVHYIPLDAWDSALFDQKEKMKGARNESSLPH